MTKDRIPDRIPASSAPPRSGIDDTFPWHFSGAAVAIDGPYAIGVITSLKQLGCAMFSVGYDGPDVAENLAKTNIVGRYIVEQLNALHPGAIGYQSDTRVSSRKNDAS